MDPGSEVDWHRLVKYLSGEESAGRAERTREWILDDGRRARLMDELKRIWDATENPPRRRDLDAAWAEMRDQLESERAKIGGKEGAGKASSSGGLFGELPNRDEGRDRATRSRGRQHRRDGWQLFCRVGAVGGAVVAVALLVVFLLDGMPFPRDRARTFSTKPGERATVHLSDGSIVRLNVDSRLTLPGDFGGERRAVDLTGEAYFEVVRDTTRPFVVHLEGTTAEVLGTAFDVRAYADDEEQQVAVTEGTVALRPEQAESRDTVLLRAKHLGIIAGSHIQTIRSDTNLERRLAWRNGQLVFEDARFQEVHRKLERWYDVRVETRMNPRTVDRLNASFDEEPVGKAVKAIATALDLRYRRKGRTVLFYRSGQGPEGRSGKGGRPS